MTRVDNADPMRTGGSPPGERCERLGCDRPAETSYRMKWTDDLVQTLRVCKRCRRELGK